MAHPEAADKGASIVGDGSSVRGDVDFGEGVRIGRGCVIEGRIRIGDRTRIDDCCVVRGLVTMEAGNWIYPFCTIGTGPQHTGHPEDPAADPAEDPGRGEIVMGSDNTVRGYASVNLPTVTARTVVGSGCHLLAYSHVAHDCTVRDGAIISAGAILGGHTDVGAGAHLGLGAMVHPRTRIGRLAMVGLRGAVTREVPPFALINDGTFTRDQHGGNGEGGDVGDGDRRGRARVRRVGRRGGGYAVRGRTGRGPGGGDTRVCGRLGARVVPAAVLARRCPLQGCDADAHPLPPHPFLPFPPHRPAPAQNLRRTLRGGALRKRHPTASCKVICQPTFLDIRDRKENDHASEYKATRGRR